MRRAAEARAARWQPARPEEARHHDTCAGNDNNAPAAGAGPRSAPRTPNSGVPFPPPRRPQPARPLLARSPHEGGPGRRALPRQPPQLPSATRRRAPPAAAAGSAAPPGGAERARRRRRRRGPSPRRCRTRPGPRTKRQNGGRPRYHVIPFVPFGAWRKGRQLPRGAGRGERGP